MDIAKTPEEARRIARVVISDIVMYNKKKIETGIAEDTLFELLREELQEGEMYYRTRVDKTLRESTNFLGEAIVDLLIKPQGKIPSKIW